MKKERADVLVFEQGLAPSRERARALILAGKVFVGEQRIDKAGDLVAREAEITVRGEDLKFASRGGLKIEGALEAFGFDVTGKVVADFGASTGGFTDCVLQRGAVRVYAIDVGYGQLHEKLRQDKRVVSMERTNARHLNATSLPERVDLVTIDASFIGLDKLLPASKEVLHNQGDILAMVKPQFEVGRGNLGKNGVVRDENARVAAINRVADCARELGMQERGRADCVIRGPEGNQETFLWLSC